MADKTINQLTEETTSATGDFAPIWDTSAGATKKVSLANIIPDDSVTTAKLADGSVTAGKIDFTSIDEDDLANIGAVSKTWTPSSITGFSANPANALYRYHKVGKLVTLDIRMPNNGTSNSTSFRIALPFAARSDISNMVWTGFARVVDNTSVLTTPGALLVDPATSTTELIVQKDFGSSASTWTASGGKRIVGGTITYEAA